MSYSNHAPLVLPAPRVLPPSRPPALARAAPAELARARAIVRQASTTSSAYLVFLGDKRLLFSRSGRAFIMYGVTSRSCIAMGDPVGPPEEHADLVRRFIALCAHHHRRPAFYRVDAGHLPLYAAHGLLPVKLGEEAVVTLTPTSVALAGPRLANLRYAATRAGRDGCSFEVIGPEALPTLLPQLMAISAAWLQTKSAREKRFSSGRFDAAYLENFPLAVVRCHGAPVAFANLWLAADRSELMVDLMRRCPHAPYGTMDFLFAGMMAWGAAQGYAQLNLGMAPLSGYGPADLPLFWRGVARLVVRHGGRFYNFDGLRRFKAKFAPDWSAKYLVCRSGIGLPVTVFDVAMLVAGGIRGLIAK